MSEALISSSISTCTRCGATIGTDDLNAGLAVRIDGNLVCEMCVDTLPGEAVVRINRMRALKGFEVTTYLVSHPKTPTLQLYSFTTAANVTNHRRKLVTDGFFEAPKLPPPGQRATIPSEPKKIVTDRVAPGVRPGRTPMLIAAGVTVAILVGIAVVVAKFVAKESPTPKDPSAPIVNHVPPPEPPKPPKTRFDYAVDPIEAWIQVAQANDCPNLVRQTIAQEVIRKRNQQLDSAEEALADRRLDEANALTNGIPLPDDFTFRDVRERENDLRHRLLAIRTTASITPPTPIKIEPPLAPEISKSPAPVSAPASPVSPIHETPPAAPPVAPIVATSPQLSPTEPSTQVPPLPVPPVLAPAPIAPVPTPPISKPTLVADKNVRVWEAPFIVTGRDKKPYELSFDGSEYIPEKFPGGMSKLYRSSRALTLKHHAMFLDLKKASLLDGGICLLVHPLRSDRKSLSFSLTDSKGKTLTLPPIPMTGAEWQPIVIPLPSDGGIDVSSLITLAIEDLPSAESIPEDGGFIVGKVVLVTERTPTIDDLALRPTALLNDDNRLRNFPNLLNIIAKNRKRANPKRLLELDHARMVVAGSWVSQDHLRTGLASILKNTYGNQNPGTAIIDAVFTDSWLDGMSKGRGSPLDPTQTHMAIWWTSAGELSAWPEVDNALTNLWKKRISQMLDVGIFPIVVIGPNSQTGALRAAGDLLWQQLLTIPQIRLQGIPVIDLRALTTAEDGSMDSDTTNKALTLIGDALNEINYLLRRHGAIK